MRLRGKIRHGRLYTVKFHLYRVLKHATLNNILMRNTDLGDKDIYRLKKKVITKRYKQKVQDVNEFMVNEGRG